MSKIVDKLLELAEKGDERADSLWLDMENMGPEQLASYVAENDSILQDVLGLNRSIMDEDLTEEDKALMDEYYSVRNTGVTNFVKPTGSARADVYGRPVHTLDEYMQAFGVAPSDNLAISDDDRAYFTNPEHPNYWKNRPENERRTVANKMGYQDLRELDEYLDRAAQDFQGRNQAEGWDANNKIDIPTFAASTIGGFVLPRTKEAKLEGREVAARDIAGDIAENALSLVPGMGTTRILSKVPKVGGRIAGSTAGQLAGTAFDQVAQPLVSQGIDAGILYNPSVLGKPGDELNLRSEFSPSSVAAQGGAIAGVKGLAKQAAGVAKNFAETRYGKTAGGQAVQNWLTPIENINEKTDDLIARRQAVLDRKAELAKRAENTNMPDGIDIVNATPVSPDDLYDADNFRILTEEAERIARSQPEREAFNRANNIRKQTELANSIARTNDRNLMHAMSQMNNATSIEDVADASVKVANALNDDIAYKIDMIGERQPYLRNAYKLDDAEMKRVGEAYRKANETGARDIVQLPDGRFIYADRIVEPNGLHMPFSTENVLDNKAARMPDNGYVLHFPEADYRQAVPKGTRPVVFAYDAPGLSRIGRDDIISGNGGFAVSRNPAVIEKIQADDLLKRKLDPKATFRREAARDIGFGNLFNAMAREGVGGLSQATGIEEKRERALWNSMVGKLRELTTDTRMPIDKRRKYADAIMNVMQYGLDGLPAELFGADPDTYREIAGKLGVADWKHYTETEPQPTPSSSRTK